MDYIWLIFLALLSILMLCKPEFLWKIEHFLFVKDGEPTDLYLALMRISGLIFLIISVICVVYLFFVK